MLFLLEEHLLDDVCLEFCRDNKEFCRDNKEFCRVMEFCLVMEFCRVVETEFCLLRSSSTTRIVSSSWTYGKIVR